MAPQLSGIPMNNCEFFIWGAIIFWSVCIFKVYSGICEWNHSRRTIMDSYDYGYITIINIMVVMVVTIITITNHSITIIWPSMVISYSIYQKITICSANSLCIHYFFRELTMNSLFFSWKYCGSTMFFANSLWSIVYGSIIFYANSLWIHYLFREFTIFF